MEKSYIVNITIKFTQNLEAKNKIEARKKVKGSFYNDYGIILENKEVDSIEEIRTIKKQK